MNLDFTKFVKILKEGLSRGIGFKLAKPKCFDGSHNQKVIKAQLSKMEDFIHIMKLDWENVVELAQTYLENYAQTWWTQVKHETGKTHGYLWEDFQE